MGLSMHAVYRISVAAWLFLAAPLGALAQDQDAIDAGEQLVDMHCAECHGEKLRSSGVVPDLRELGPGDRDKFLKTVQEGRGQMPAWGGVLGDQELDQIWAYIRSRAAK
jgi:mono/diheme cytochrome c family protein